MDHHYSELHRVRPTRAWEQQGQALTPPLFTSDSQLVMHPPTVIGFVATLLIAWVPGGLIHRGAQQVNRNAEPPVWNLIETVRANTAAMVKL